MANLLPQDKKKEIRKEYNLRVLIVSLFLLWIVLAIASTLLFSLHILLNSRLSELDQMHAVVVEESEDAIELKRLIDSTQTKLELLQHDNLPPKIPYGIFKTVFDIKPENVYLTKIAYLDDQITVDGFASHRNDLQDFVFAIGKHEMFLPVEYPFSNITQKEDIDFSLSISLVKNDEK